MYTQWIGLRKNLQETIDFPIKYGAFRFQLSQKNQSIDTHMYTLNAVYMLNKTAAY